MPRIAICAPSTPITREDAARVTALAKAEFPLAHLHFHEQCFAEEGHFAGSDETRLNALLECANDPFFDTVWFAKGGYGAVRIANDALLQMGPVARKKRYLGYSDAGYLLGLLYRHGYGSQAHGPMPVDIRREGGEAAVRRALGWLCGDNSGLEPSLDDRNAVAFNLMTLAMICGTDLKPDLVGHVVMIEEVSEHLYAIDRLLFHVTNHLWSEGVGGIRLGRISAVPENDRPFGLDPVEMTKFWCRKAGIEFLGRADIGHDAANRIVPFGLAG